MAEVEEASALVHLMAKSIVEQIAAFGSIPIIPELSREDLTLIKGLKGALLAKLLRGPFLYIYIYILPLLGNSRNVSRQECRCTLEKQ
jgi:hypothetical protein